MSDGSDVQTPPQALVWHPPMVGGGVQPVLGVRSHLGSHVGSDAATSKVLLRRGRVVFVVLVWVLAFSVRGLLLGLVGNTVVVDPLLVKGPNAFAVASQTVNGLVVPVTWGRCDLSWSFAASERTSVWVGELVESAFAMVGEKTGFRFRQLGVSHGFGRSADVVVSVGDRLDVRGASHDASGDIEPAGVTSVDATFVDGRKVFVKARVVLSKGMLDSKSHDFGTQNSVGSVIAHEFGHVVGLGHVNFVGSLMHPVMEDTGFSFSPGDVEGFRRVGGNCLKGPQVLKP